MYRIHEFTQNGRLTHHGPEDMTREDHIGFARTIAAGGHRAQVWQKMRGGWHCIFDSETGY